MKNDGRFHSFCEEEIGKLLAKNIARTAKNTARRTTYAIWRLFTELNIPLSPKLANKKAIEYEFNIDGNKHVLACFQTRNYFE